MGVVKGSKNKSKRAEEALHESEERFRQMVDLLPEAVCEIDISGNILFGNRAAFIMIGYDRADFEKGLNILPMIAPEDQERALTNIGRLIAGEALGADEYTLVRKDGSRFPATVHIANILNAAGKTVGFRGIVVDITERRRAAETQQRLAAIVESSHDAIISKTLDGIITSWNKGAEERYGYSAAEVVGRSISIIVPPDRAGEVPLFLETIRRGGAVIDFESERITKDGRRLTVLLTISPIKDVSGKVVGASTIAQDVTERKRAEERTKQVAAEWQTTFDSIADMVSIQSRDFKLVRVNKAYADAVGMKLEDVVGKHCYEVVHNASSHIVNCPHRQTIETKKAVTQEVFEPGLNAYLEVSTSPIFDSDGEVIGSVHIAKNITWRKKADIALGERLKELNCLYGISAVLEMPGISLGEILQRVALLIPAAWQFPDITEACIVLEGQTFKTARFRETPWMLSRGIVVNGKTVGQIQVCYLEERQAGDEGLFMIEERHLLDAIAERIGRVIERVWVEEALQQSEERYRSLYVDSKDAVMILSPDEGFLSGNPAAVEMFGCRDEQDFVRRTPASLSPEYQPDGALSVDKSREMMRLALEKGSHSFEWTHRRADGVDFLATVLLSRMGGGKRLLQATVRDITESKRTQEALRQFVDRLSLATRAGGVGIWDYDVINNKLIWDDQMYHLYGITPDKFGGAYEAWRAGVHPEDLLKGDAEVQMALRGEKDFDTEFRVVWPDGTIRNIRALAIVQRDASGKPMRMIGTNWDITERKKAEEALKKSTRLLRDTGAMAKVGGWELDVATREQVWTEEVYRIHEVDVTYKPTVSGGIDFYAPTSRPIIERAVQRAIEHGEPFDVELEIVTAKGNLRWVRAIGRREQEHGKVLGTFQDITERKNREEQISSLNEQQKIILDASPAMIFYKDKENRFIRVNEALAKATGLSKEEMEGKTLWDLYPREAAEKYWQDDKRVMAGGKPSLNIIEEMKTPLGTRWVQTDKVPYRNSKGEIVGIIGFTLDITERKKAEDALRESEDRIRLLLDSAAEAIYGIDVNGNCTFCNSACLRMLGYKRPDELLGRNMHWQIHSKHPDGTPFPVEECRIFQAFRSGKGTHVDDEVLWRSDGTSFAAEYWSYPLLRDGVVAGAVVTFLDITERKRSDEMIRIRLSLLDFSATHSLEELLQKTLDDVGGLTGSPIGFYHFVEKDQKTLSLQAWSTRTVKEFCKAEGQGMHYGIDKAGVWVDCVRQRRPVIHNDYLSLSHRKGLPAGHAVVVRELVVPIMRGGDVVAVLGIGNKSTNYTDNDVEVVSYLADVAWEITERKRAQEALRDSEEKIRGIFDAIADSVTVVDMNGKIIELNEAAVRLFGLKSKAEAIGMDGLAFVADEDLTTVTGQMGEVFLIGKTAQLVQFRYKRLDGAIFYGETSSVVLHGAQGNVIGLIGVIRDVTERRRLEGAIRESEKKFRALFEDSIDAVVISTVDGKILDFNGSLLSLTGYEREELLGLNAVKLYANSVNREMLMTEIQKTGSVKEYEVKWVKKDGIAIDVVMTLTARRDEGGNIIGYQGIVRDVTERRRLEAMLKSSEKRFRELADFLPQTICEIDLNGRFTYANKYGVEAHGYTKEEIEKSLNAIDLFIPAQRDRVLQNISRVLSGQKFDDHEYSVLRKDGSTYPALLYTNAIVRNGQVAGVRALVVDITERKKIEQMKTDFVSFISHQLRTPVAGLMGYIDNMLDGVTGTLNDMQVDYLREMRGVCERNSRLIYDLLSISRLERGVLAVNIAPVDLRSAVDIAVKEHRKAIEEKGLALNLSGVDREAIVLADNDKLVEVLKNVIHNATKFTSTGSINIEIVAEGQQGIVKISDTGTGLSRSALQDLFKKERVFGGAMAVGGGSGLGLYIAKGFMHLQHGDITAESVEGKGSTFIISLPRK